MKIPQLVKVPMRFGFYGGIIAAFLIILLFYMNRHPLLIPIIFDFRMILIPVFLFIGVKDFRNRANNNVLHFWQGIAAGFVIYVIIGFFGSFSIMVFSTIEPQFLTEFVEFSREQLITNKETFLQAVGTEAYNKTLDNLPFTRPIHLAFDYFLKTLMIGILFTIIISVILRRPPKI